MSFYPAKFFNFHGVNLRRSQRHRAFGNLAIKRVIPSFDSYRPKRVHSVFFREILTSSPAVTPKASAAFPPLITTPTQPAAVT